MELEIKGRRYHRLKTIYPVITSINRLLKTREKKKNVGINIQTCHSPGETNLNEYEKKSECGKKNLNDIAPPPPPPPALSYRRLMKSIHQEGRKKSPPSWYRGVNIYPQFKTKKTHSLQVKGLYNRAGIDQVKRLKIMDQLQKRLKWIIFIVTAEGGNPF